jgi:hypothetical protein
MYGVPVREQQAAEENVFVSDGGENHPIKPPAWLPYDVETQSSYSVQRNSTIYPTYLAEHARFRPIRVACKIGGSAGEQRAQQPVRI